MKKICKNIWLAAACMFMLTACSQKSNKTVIDNEPTTITWIEDKPGGNVQPISLYPMCQIRCGMPWDLRMAFLRA